MLGVACRQVKASRRFGTFKNASGVASLCSPSFKGAKERTAYAPKSRVWRHVVQRNRAMISDRTAGDDHVALNRNEKRTGLLCDPRFDDFWSLVRQPSLEECRVIPVIGNTKFRYRSPQYIARSDCID